LAASVLVNGCIGSANRSVAAGHSIAADMVVNCSQQLEGVVENSAGLRQIRRRATSRSAICE
jgi:hypothetical protein